MKRLIAITLVFITVFGFAQQKPVETSSKKQPGWVNNLEKDYIIVSGSGPTAQDAQQKALTMVKERIVSSVAENVKTSSEMKVEEANFNNNISVFLEKFASTTKTTSGPVPFLQGISLSKVEEFYWEKFENKSTRSVYFNYHIKYPFPEIELQKLVFDFKQRDKELTKQLDDLLEAVDKVPSVEVIEKNIGELKVLADYFMDGRKDKANLGIKRYSSLFNSIELVELESGLGQLKYALRLGNRFIDTVRKPQVTSDCARITGTTNNKDHVLITYDYFNCYDDPENNIMVSYRFGNNTVKKAFYFDITADKASIFVNEPIRFTALSKNNGTIQGSDISIKVVSKYQAPFTIVKVELEWPGHPPVVIDNVGRSFEGKGNHSLSMKTDQLIQVETTTSLDKRVSLLSGYIHFRSDKTGEMKTYRIYNHNYTTNW